MAWRCIIRTLATALLLSGLAAHAQNNGVGAGPPRTIYVNLTAGENVQSVVRFAQKGDTIWVGPGTNHLTSVLSIPAGVNLRGSGEKQTCFDLDPTLSNDGVQANSGCMFSEFCVIDTNVDGLIRYPITVANNIGFTNVVFKHLYAAGATDGIFCAAPSFTGSLLIDACEVYSKWDACVLSLGVNSVVNIVASVFCSDGTVQFTGGVNNSAVGVKWSNGILNVNGTSITVTNFPTESAGYTGLVSSGFQRVTFSGCSFYTQAGTTAYDIKPANDSASGTIILCGSSIDPHKIKVGIGQACPINWCLPPDTILAADTNNASVQLTNANLSVLVLPGHAYNFRLVLLATDSTAADGFSLDFGGGTVSASNFRATVTATDTALQVATAVTSLTTVVNVTSFATGQIIVEGTITTSSGGTLIPRFAQKAHSTGTATVFAGSRLYLVY